METQPEKPVDETVYEESAPEEVIEGEDVRKVEEKDVDDIRPIRGADVRDAGKQILQTAQDGVLRPAYEVGWRWLRGGQAAAEAFFEGALGGKKKGKK